MKKMPAHKAQELFDSVALNPTYTEQYKINCLQYILKQLHEGDVDNTHILKLVQESKYADAANWYHLQVAVKNYSDILKKKKKARA